MFMGSVTYILVGMSFGMDSLSVLYQTRPIAGFVGDEGIAGTVLGSTGCVGHGLQVLYGVAGE